MFLQLQIVYPLHAKVYDLRFLLEWKRWELLQFFIPNFHHLEIEVHWGWLNMYEHLFTCILIG
jgi:hypothetical protein